MYELSLIGIGTGNPDHVTFQGARAIREADLILIPRKGENKADLAGLREEIIAQVTETMPRIAYFDIPRRRSDDGYLRGVDEWHDAIAFRLRTLRGSRDPDQESPHGFNRSFCPHCPALEIDQPSQRPSQPFRQRGCLGTMLTQQHAEGK